MSVSITSSLKVALVSGTGVTFSAPVIPLISTDDVYDPNNPAVSLTDLLSGISSAQLVGSATVNGTSVGNTALFTCPNGQKFVPTMLAFTVNGISGSGEPPAINVGFTATDFRDYLDSVSGVTYDLTGGAPFAAGAGYLIGDVLTLSGGTHSVVATITITSASIAALNVNAAGTVYAPGDTITLAGGVSSIKGIVTVSTVKLVSATIHGGAAGTGYDGGSPATFDVSVAGGTHSVVATVNVTTDGSGHVSAINSVSAAGSYTVLPTLSNNAVTGDDGTHHGTGLGLDLVFGVNTIALTTNGSYTTETVSFTQFATSGSGSGATFNSATYGLLGFSISAAGTYTVIPGNHITLTGGSGASASLDGQWAVVDGGVFDAADTLGAMVLIDRPDTAGNNGVFLTGGEEVFVRVAFASTFDTYSVKVFMFGFPYTG